MLKTTCLLVSVLVMLETGAVADVSTLGVLEDQKLSDFISTLDHVATSERLPFRVKIFKSYERGECQGTPQSCPRVRLYLSVSTFDEAPDYRVYVSSAANDWSFDRWGAAPDGDGPKDMITVLLERSVIGKDPSKSWFQKEKVKVTLNPWNGALEVVGP